MWCLFIRFSPKISPLQIPFPLSNLCRCEAWTVSRRVCPASSLIMIILIIAIICKPLHDSPHQNEFKMQNGAQTDTQQETFAQSSKSSSLNNLPSARSLGQSNNANMLNFGAMNWINEQLDRFPSPKKQRDVNYCGLWGVSWVAGVGDNVIVTVVTQPHYIGANEKSR